jgi:hypothetical protein
MKLVRAKQFLVTVTAIFSLFVSAISACACSHHEPVKVETSSCHSSSHEAPAAEQPNGSDQVDTGCNCFVRTPVPAIVAKKDDKRTAVEQQLAEVVELPVTIDAKFNITSVSDLPFQPPQSNYKHALLASLPSRAPPRL